MRILPCMHCAKFTQHIIFSKQVQCQRCGKGTKKADINKYSSKTSEAKTHKVDITKSLKKFVKDNEKLLKELSK